MPPSAAALAAPRVVVAFGTNGNQTSEQTWAFENGESSVAPPLSGLSPASPDTALRLPSSAVVVPEEAALEGGWGSGVSRACGPALRLTSSQPASSGAAWYARDVTVGEVCISIALSGMFAFSGMFGIIPAWVVCSSSGYT